jgi:hypothetical protein
MQRGFFRIFVSALLMAGGTAWAATVEYTIPAGTADGLKDWNSKAAPLAAKVGDTLVIKNGDSQPHQLHTNGAPCEHGELMQPGESWSCKLEAPYDSRKDGDPIRDHLNYDLKFWLVVTP